ncbi:heme o synthase [Oceanobacillus saliphilus]|uniref:heme o synthase n=1 Tax=Oceanobacillus saliphilus TaxID=2925834 RepID=UPI0027D213D0|nr:heme o synthase [Oceanobacillus saliphilus]
MNSKDSYHSQKHPEINSPIQNTTLIKDIKSLIKFRVLIANVLPVFVGFWLALYFSGGSFSENIGTFILALGGSTFLMGGALILNNWYDADIDKMMERTKNRPTVTGNFPLKKVLVIGIMASAAGGILLLFTTVESAIYGFIGWFTYVVLYTIWSKRRYTMNTLIGSVSGAVTPLIGWGAVETAIHPVPIVLFLLLFIWQIPHTFTIAIKKHDEYKAAGVAMLPVVHGIEITKRQMVVYIICLLPLPFLLASLGLVFVVASTILNITWLIIAVRGFFTDDNWKWAHMNFLYSVNYLTVIFLMMVLVTLPIL